MERSAFSLLFQFLLCALVPRYTADERYTVNTEKYRKHKNTEGTENTEKSNRPAAVGTRLCGGYVAVIVLRSAVFGAPFHSRPSIARANSRFFRILSSSGEKESAFSAFSAEAR